MKSIKQKMDSLSFKLISIDNIPQPKFLEEDDSSSNFMMAYGGSPFFLLYKKIKYEDASGKKGDFVVVIKKFLFVFINVTYYLNPNE